MGCSRISTRRGLLRGGLAIGVLAPTLASLTQVGSAFADDGDDDPDEKSKPAPKPAPAPAPRLEAFSSDLVTVAQSAASGDLASGNPGTDSLSDGRVTLVRRDAGGEGKADVVLRGAAANASYDVFFLGFNQSKGREALGTVGPTNDAGNLNQRTPNALSGSSRVGIFIIARTSDGSAQAGKDEFVSSLGG
jgi:hypothetical protein